MAELQTFIFQLGSSELELPDADDGEEELVELLDSAARRIADEWAFRKRAAASGSGPRSRASGDRPRRQAGPTLTDWLTHITYVVIQAFTVDHEDWMFDRRIEEFGRTKGRPGSDNLFRRGLLAIFAHGVSGPTAAERERIAMRLQYAFRHYVPAPFVIAFLRHVGGKVADRNRLSEIDPEFYNWVVEQRAIHGLYDRYRQDYPKDLEKLVRRRIKHNAKLKLEEIYDLS